MTRSTGIVSRGGIDRKICSGLAPDAEVNSRRASLDCTVDARARRSASTRSSERSFRIIRRSCGARCGGHDCLFSARATVTLERRASDVDATRDAR